MTHKPRFVTIFPDTENIHLIKDVGQIPYFMYKTQGYDAELVSYKNNEQYPYLDDEVKGLKLTFIPNLGRFFYFEIGVIKYLLASSGSIDVLNLFHFKKDNLFYLLVYKFLNPKGKSLIKLDIDLLFFKQYNALFYSRYRLKKYFLKVLTQWIFKLTDFISIETEDAREYLLKVCPELENKLICIPNGVDDLYLEKNIKLRSYDEKENIIITVGRIGTTQKNTELFLEALALTDLGEWRVYILGPIEETFKNYIDHYFLEHPHLKKAITFTGNITDRKELLEWYNRAKIFCLSSRREAFCLVFTEALYFGNYIITSPVSSADYITDHGKHGAIVEPEASAFSRALQKSMSPGFLTKERYEEIRNFSQKNFTWPVIVKKISDILKTNA